MKTLLPLLAVVVLLAGCATQAPDVTTHVDQFTNERTDLMEDILLKSPTEPPRELVWINATRYAREFNRAPIFLGIAYMASAETGLLEIEPGPSLTVIADGQTIRLNGSGSVNLRGTLKHQGQDFVKESAIYELTATQLTRISQAKQVKVQVRGRNGLIERQLDADAFERLRRFVSYLAI